MGINNVNQWLDALGMDPITPIDPREQYGDKIGSVVAEYTELGDHNFADINQIVQQSSGDIDQLRTMFKREIDINNAILLDKSFLHS